MQSFEYQEIAKRLSALRGEVEQLLRTEPKYSDLWARIQSDLQTIGESEPLRIAFVGQYNAGKSTLIRALTGDTTIVVDSDVATGCSTEYPWHSVVLTDTPGIHAGRPDHDLITMDAIRKADLLVYNITYSLFDPLTLSDFRDLAFQRGYQRKMLLSINRMDSEGGEWDDLVKAYRTTINHDLSPAYIDQFRPVFLAAQLAHNPDPEAREFSHFDDFVRELNRFVEESGLFARLTAPAQVFVDLLRGGILEAESTEDREIQSLLNRIERTLVRSLRDADNELAVAKRALRTEILAKAPALCQKIGSKTFGEDLDRVPAEIEDCSTRNWRLLSGRLDAVADDHRAALEDLRQNSRWKFVFDGAGPGGADMKAAGPKGFDPQAGKSPGPGSRLSQEASKLLGSAAGEVAKATGAASVGGFAKASQVAGSSAHKVIVGVAGQLGLKLKPWQAVNLAKNLGNFAKAVGPIMSAVAVVTEVADIVQEDKSREQREKTEALISQYFAAEADSSERQFDESYKEYRQQSYVQHLEALRADRKSSLEARDRLSSLGQRLAVLADQMLQILKEGE